MTDEIRKALTAILTRVPKDFDGVIMFPVEKDHPPVALPRFESGHRFCLYLTYEELKAIKLLTEMPAITTTT